MHRLETSRQCPAAAGGLRRRRGSALLAVMWMSAALAAIAFSLSSTVRSEADRAASELESVRAYYLATGAIERATLEIMWSAGAGADKRPIREFATGIDYSFATGTVHVDILPEAGKLSINAATPEELNRLMLALGAEPMQAEAITEGIVAWRTPAVGAQPAQQAISPQGPSFQPAHASFQEIEELLQVPGVTPEIFYGSFVPVGGTSGQGAQLQLRPGLIDCLSTFGTKDKVDINTAQPAVLAAIGIPPGAITAIVEQRQLKPFSQGDLNSIGADLGMGAPRIRVEGNSILTLRATARVSTGNGQLSDLKRSVAAMIKYMPQGWDSPIHVLRWYDFAMGSN